MHGIIRSHDRAIVQFERPGTHDPISGTDPFRHFDKIPPSHPQLHKLLTHHRSAILLLDHKHRIPIGLADQRSSRNRHDQMLPRQNYIHLRKLPRTQTVLWILQHPLNQCGPRGLVHHGIDRGDLSFNRLYQSIGKHTQLLPDFQSRQAGLRNSKLNKNWIALV